MLLFLLDCFETYLLTTGASIGVDEELIHVYYNGSILEETQTLITKIILEVRLNEFVQAR